ncbi:Potassium/sodium hyperpolarization-activated cyclic nucleotide-gated channel 4, partial [Kappamyces sp. JEL0680]
MLLLPLGIAYSSRQSWLIPLSIVMGLTQAADTFIQLNMGIVQDQELEMTPSEVWSHHWKKRTILKNIIGGFPYVIITQLATPQLSAARDFSNLICLINGYTLLQVVKSTQVSLISEKAKQIIHQFEINQTMVTLVQLLVGIVTYWHWYVCAVVFLSGHGGISSAYPYMIEADIYTLQLFNSASLMFSSGWAVAAPDDTGDRIPKIINMVLSAFLFCLFTANITTYMIRLDSSGRQFAEKLEEVSQYIMYKQLGNDLRDRIMQYYHFKYNKGKYFDENNIMGELNEPLRISIAMRQCASLISQVPFFKDADHSFLAQVVPLLKVSHFLQDDPIVEENTTGDQMFFIESGSVEILSGGKSVTVLHPGQFFGEITLLFGSMKRTATVKAITECVIYSLSQPDLETVLEINPTLAESMRKIAEQRLKDNKVKITIPSEKRMTRLNFEDRTFSAGKFQNTDRSDRRNSSGDSLRDPTKAAIAIASARKQSFITSKLSVEALHANIESLPEGGDGNAKKDGSEHSDPSLDAVKAILQSVEDDEVKNFSTTSLQKPAVASFIEREFLPKTADGAAIAVIDPDTKESTEIIDAQSRRKSKMHLTVAAQEMATLEEEKSLQMAVPLENKTIKASHELLSPANEHLLGEAAIDIEDDIDDDMKPKKSKKKVTKESDDDGSNPPSPKITRKQKMMDKPDGGPGREDKDPTLHLSMAQKMARFWNKYQPSLSYCPIHPSSNFSRIWNSVIEVSWAIVVILLPMTLSLPDTTAILRGLSVFITIMSVFDLLIKLQTGKALAQEVEMEPKKIAAMFVRDGTFVFDF